jgi:hypothetical protein
VLLVLLIAGGGYGWRGGYLGGGYGYGVGVVGLLLIVLLVLLLAGRL